MSNSSSIPETQVAVYRDEEKSELRSIPVPQPAAGEVLVRNVAVASNPKDWKHPRLRHQDYSYVEGNDIAGEIVKVGEGVTDLKVGQRVAAFTKMGARQDKYGAYAEYSVSPANTVIPIPDDLPFEDASTLPLAIFTAAVGLFVSLGIDKLPDVPKIKPVEERKEGVIVYGASSSVGAYVVQLAKLAGYFVVGVAGASTEYVLSLGADAVIDYRKYKGAVELGGAIVDALGGRSSLAGYDTIVTGNSPVAIAHALSKASPGGAGKLTHILPLSPDVKDHIPPTIETSYTFVGSAFEKDAAFCEQFSRQLKAYLTASGGSRALQANRVKVLPNGLASVSEGLKLLEENKVHAEKLVYRIAETPKSTGRA